MAERGATPQVPALSRRALSLARSFTSPRLPDDYLEMINPLRSTRELGGRVGSLGDVGQIHGGGESRTGIFGAELRGLHSRAPGYRLHERHSRSEGRLKAAELDQICPDWRERETFICGPAGLLAALKEHYDREGDPARLNHEHFQPDALIGSGEQGCGGSIRLCSRGLEAVSDRAQPILPAGEQAGPAPPLCCRLWVWHSCVWPRRSRPGT